MTQGPILLSFDTSAAHCAAAVLFQDRCLHRFEPMEKGQAERLFPLLEELLAEAELGWSDLTAIAVGTGPGNFTGVRISVAAARGLALALGVPAIGVTKLEALAYGQPRPVTVIEDARRGEVYVQTFTADGPLPATVGPAEDFAGITGPFVGNAAANPLPVLPLAEAIALIARERLGQTLPRPAPFYLRGADAAPSSDPPPVILP